MLGAMRSHGYALDLTWPAIIEGAGLRLPDVLRRAGLPPDVFAQTDERLASDGYFRLWEALEAESGDGLLPLRLYRSLRAESFSPPLFAALASPNLVTALHRLATYKTLVAPMRLDVTEAPSGVAVELSWIDRALPPPASLVLAELLFFVCLARMGTREEITPRRVTTSVRVATRAPYDAFVGVPLTRGATHTVVFDAEDARRPFRSKNDGMWAIFEPALRRRLEDLEGSATMAERVRAALLEGLPSGQLAIDVVAQRLALSKRTLQRRLGDEGTSFQDVLQKTREALATHYLERTRLPLAEISFLLGFEQPNSFFRAFHCWTGRTPETVRRAAPAA